MPVDAGTPPSEIDQLAVRFHASAIVAPKEVAEARHPDPVPLDDDLSVVRRRDAASAEEAALYKVTSGSTGLPKAILATEANLVADALHIIEAMEISAADTQIAAIPLSHAYGFGNLLMPLLLQGTAIVLRDSFVPQFLTDDAQRYRARVFPGVPFMFHYFLSNPPAGGWPAALTHLISAGAPLEPATLIEFHARFGRKIHSFYGATETGGISFDHSDEAIGDGSVGWPLPGVTLTTIAGDGIPEEYGRVHVRSEAVARGYVGEPDAGHQFVDGGFLTGDYGHVAPDGRVMLAGRVSAFINVAGRKVHPGEVERVLRLMPGVTDARVVGAADGARGEQIVAVLAVAQRVAPADVRRFCSTKLAPHKVPRAVVFVEAIPMTERGKTDQRALAALAQACAAGAD